MARLIVTLNNKVLGNHMVAADRPVTIGRHSDNHISIDNMAVSAHHAKISFDDQKLVVVDLGSRNGTLVNNEKITRCTLTHQDWVTIGKHIIIVDYYESLSLEATADQLIAGSEAASDADQTMLLDRIETQPTWTGFDYLSFLSANKEDFELTDQVVTIGKNPDADIRISGLRSFFAGSPSATIMKHSDGYILTPAGGRLKVMVNGSPIKDPAMLKHQDTVAIGPVQFQIRVVRRPSR
jgi:pSer/pThr/pTyr-binding forkhead associated (FHA) protein